MITKIGNQAYSYLNGVLSLPGSRNLGYVDMSAVFPTHDLDSVIRAGEVFHCFGVGELVTPAGGSNNRTFDLSAPLAYSRWEARYRGNVAAAATGTVSDRFSDDWDYLLVSAGAYSRLGTFVRSQFAINVDTHVGVGRYPLTSEFVNTNFSMCMPVDGGQYYLLGMPMWIVPEIQTIVYYADQGGGPDHTADCLVEYFAAPPGVLKVPADQ